MNANDTQLIADYLAGEEVSEALLEACRERPELLKELADHVVTERLVAFVADDEDEKAFSKENLERLRSTADDAFVERVLEQLTPVPKKRSHFPLYAMAACLMLGFVLFFTRPQQQEDTTLAQLTSSTDAVWANGSHELGEAINAGLLKLEEGYSEITLRNNVRLILEAPVELNLESLDQITLISGRLVARVPKAAIGFTVLTPESEIVDLGTEFGVEVARDGATEVHVLEGEVKARGRKQEAFSNLLKDEAMSIDAEQTYTFMHSRPEQFRRALPGRSTADPGYLHWPCDRGGSQVECIGSGIEGELFPGTLRSSRKENEPDYQNGKFGDALHFNGRGGHVETAFPGIGSNNPRTVAFWTKVPKDSSTETGYAMVSWGLFKKESAWQISPNPSQSDGPLGRIRIGTLDAYVIGSTDLRDDSWHHIAIVMYGGDEADLSTHIFLYVDGKLEKSSRKSVARIDTDLGNPASKPLTLGKNLNRARNKRFFKGWLDEIYVFDTALEPEKIRSLMHYNRLGN